MNMENFDWSKNKYTIVLGALAISFIIAIGYAFTFLPSESDYVKTGSINVPRDGEENVKMSERKTDNDDETAESNDTDDDTDDYASDSDRTDIQPPSTLPDEYGDKNSDISADNTDDFSRAREYIKSGNYVLGASEYVRLADNYSDIKIKSQCYENASTAYAMAKRYGTALAYAQKAYNMYPTTSKELLLARLYYKTGQTDNATSKIDDILKRDFAAEK